MNASVNRFDYDSKQAALANAQNFDALKSEDRPKKSFDENQLDVMHSEFESKLGINPEYSKKSSDEFSDKPLDKNFLKNIWKKIDQYCSNGAIAVNVIGSFLNLINIPDKTKEFLANIVDKITNLSFVPYGLDGMRKAFFENKNPYMFFGFLLETSLVWKSDLKNKYLIRGAATGTDQIWVATEHKLEEKDAQRFQEGKFQSWRDGFIETPKACLSMLKDIVTNPKQALATIDREKGSGGYYALLSSIGSIVSTIGYFITRNEKIFGTIRDISGILFDWEMLLKKDAVAKLSGAFFIAESALDFAAKFIVDNNTRLFVNMLSHAAGREALQLYKSCNKDKDEENSQDKKQYELNKENKLDEKQVNLVKSEQSADFKQGSYETAL